MQHFSPQILSANILPYLKVRDLRTLDTALTSRALQEYRRVMWSSFVYQYTSRSILFAEFLWLCCRKCTVVGVAIRLNHIRTLPPLPNALNDLRELVLCNCKRRVIAEGVAQHFSRICPNLTSFSAICTENTLVGLFPIVNQCRQLRKLLLEDVQLADPGLQLISMECPNLMSVSLKYCDSLTDIGLISMSRSCHQLSEVFLSACDFSDTGIQALASNNPMLHSLILCGFPVSSKAFNNIWQAIPHIVELDLEFVDVTNSSIISLARTCLMLQKLHIMDFPACSDQSIIELVQHCHYLRHVLIMSTPGSDMAIVHSGLWHILHAEHEPSFCFHACPLLTDTVLTAIASSYPNLQSIHANNCNFTDAGVSTLLCQCHALQEIVLDKCKVSREGFTLLCNTFPQIKNIGIGWMDILDTDIIHLIIHCTALEILRIIHCNHITDASVTMLVDQCCSLKNLDINDCADISIASLHTLQRRSHHLKKKRRATGEISEREGCSLDWCLHGFGRCCRLCDRRLRDADSDASSIM